jgi:hypothetical protein
VEEEEMVHLVRRRAPARSTYLILAAGVLTLASLLPAQTITTGDISGTVTDPTGALVPNALVTLRNTENGQTRTQNSNNDGAYRFTALQGGQYQISATSTGLKSDVGQVMVSIGQVMAVNLIVKPEESKQTVMVTDAVPLIQSDNANLSTTFSSRQLQALPLPGGDTTTPAFTAPGVTVNVGSGYGNFSSHGLPGTANLFTVNGNDNEDPYLNLNNSGSSNLTLGANEVSEIAVVQNAYSVSYGRQAGAQVNEVTKSGTNEFHGNLVWNWNGDILNANDFFNNVNGVQRPRSTSNQYAASLGGPIRRNKTFFFVDTEGIRYVLPTTGVVAMPSQQFENYILQTVQPSQVALYQNAFKIYSGAPGAARATPVTNGSGPLQDGNGNLGCGSVAGTPAPGGGTFGVDVACADAYGVNASNHNNEWLMVARVDHQINNKQNIFFRFRTDHGQQPTGTSLINPAFSTQSIQPEYEGQIDYTYTISPTVVNHAIASASWYSAIFGPASLSSSLSTFPTYFQLSGIGGANGANGGGAGFTNMGLETTLFPQGRRVGQGQVIDDLSIIKGNHTIKVGGNYRKNQVTDISPQTLTQGGAYIFGDMADFAGGNLASGASFYQQQFANFDAAHIRFYNLGTYVQDEWAIRQNLKLTLGIRFDRTGDPECLDKCFSRFPNQFSPSAAFGTAVNTPYNQSIQTGLLHEFGSIEPVVYQPRIGFVWSPSKKTVLRGGIGIFSDLAPGGLVSSVFDNPPNLFLPTVTSGLVAAPGTLTGSAPLSAALANSAFRTGFANGYTLAQIQALTPASAPFTSPNFFATPNKIYNPKYAEWNFDVQQELDNKTAISISYVGNHGYDLLMTNNLVNASNPGTTLPGFGFLPPSPPDPRFSAINSVSNAGISNYDGMTVQIRRSMSHGFQMQANYTWSHALDDISSLPGEPFSNFTSFSGTFYPYNKSLNYGNSDFDIRHNFTADFTWEPPYKFSNRMVNAVAGGWVMGGRFYARSGTPFSIVYDNIGSQLSPGAGYTTGLGTAYNAILAGVNGSVPLNCTNVNQVCFSQSEFNDNGFGNIARNSFRGPGYFDIDYNVYKSFAIRERLHMQIGASFYNLLNHPNFAPPGIAVNGGSLGVITSTASPPTSAYGSFTGSAVSGRVIVSNVTVTF